MKASEGTTRENEERKMVEGTRNTRMLRMGHGNGEGFRERITVLLVDDHPMVREGMRRLLEGEGGFEVVAEVESVEGALEELERVKAEIVVMDIQLPGVNGVEGTRMLKAKYPELKGHGRPAPGSACER